MTTIAIYARHSSDKQATSTEDQIARCKAYCAQKGYNVVEIFSDEAISGSVSMKQRQGIHDLIDASLECRFEKIIAEDLSRLSRDQGDIAHFFKKMLFLDIEIETINEGVVNELHIGLKGTMNALYLKDLADKTRRGMIASVLKGAVPGGKTYGYKKVQAIQGGEVVRGLRKIDKNQADIVRQIFSYYLEGKSTNLICELLNRQGIESPSGRKWDKTTLIGTHSRQTGLLRQTLYKGEITFNRMAYKHNPITGKRVSIVRPQNEWIRVPIPELAIISEDTFNATQRMIEERSQRRKDRIILTAQKTADEKKEEHKLLMRSWRAKQTKTRHHYNYLTSRRLVCGHCDGPISAYAGGRDKCKNKECNHNNSLIREQTINFTLAELRKFTEDHIKGFTSVEYENSIGEKEFYERKLERTRSEVRVLLKKLSQTQRGKETLNYLSELESECTRIAGELRRCDDLIKKYSPPNDKERSQIVQRFLKTVEKFEKKPDDLKTIKLLQSVIPRIEVHNTDNIKVTYDIDELIKTFPVLCSKYT